MNTNFIKLFAEIIHAAEILAEQVVELDHNEGDHEAEKKSLTMRDDYAKFYDRLRDKDFDFKTLSKNDFVKILIGSILISRNLEARIEQEKKVLHNYKINIIPRLERIIKEGNDNDSCQKLAIELFEEKIF